jgi:hypothetical protein
MNDTLSDDVIRTLESISDNALSRVSLRANGEDFSSLSTPTSVPCRYEGTRKLPPGPPVGLHLAKDGVWHLEQIAIVRVPQESSALQAQSIMKHSMKVALAASLLCTIVTIALFRCLAAPPSNSGATPMAPCYITKLMRGALTCRVGAHEVLVREGTSFPDGRFQLGKISSGLDGFTAMGTHDHRRFLFQFQPAKDYP